jgi:hypothetical protein
MKLRAKGGAGVRGCGCGRETLGSAGISKVVDGVEHRWGEPCKPGPGGRMPRTPLAEVADSFARLAEQAQADRKLHARGTWEDGEAAGRFNAYRNAAARMANIAGVVDPLDEDAA